MNVVLKKIICSVFVLMPVLTATEAFSANTFTVTVPAGTEAVMQNPNSILPLTVANQSVGKDIRQITFTVNSAQYSFNSLTVPPSGWCVSSLSAGSITFALTQAGGACNSTSTASRITPGASLVFNVNVTPAAAAQDVANDALTGAAVNADPGMSLSGALPAWTRRSLEMTMNALPSSVGIGSPITLNMQIINRSTAAQSLIASTPDPPTPVPTPGAITVAKTAGPFYGSTLLTSDVTAASTVIAVGSTTGFPATGTIQIDSEKIAYSGVAATSFTGLTRGCCSTAAAGHAGGAVVYDLTQFSLAAGQTGTITWQYSANGAGTVHFNARAQDAAALARSISGNSNTVFIGSFTAALSVAPQSVVSGQSVLVQMTASNNGATALINAAPTPPSPGLSTCVGGASETYVSGPTPASIPSIAPSAVGVFNWTYAITGTVGQAYCLSGSASADGPLTSNSATSNAGEVSNYSVSVAPSAISSGSVNQTLTWTVVNGGGFAVSEVDIATPVSGANWNCASTTPPANWSGACAATVVFSSPNSANDIPASGSRQFAITFSSTEQVTSDRAVLFPVTIKGRTAGVQGILGSSITINAYGLTLTHSPAGPVYADGSAYYTMTATLTLAGSPASGKGVSFSTSNGSLSAASGVTDANGQSAVRLTANSAASATVTASYLGASRADAVAFNAWTKADMQYQGVGAPTTLPMSVNCGSPYSFTMLLKNASASQQMPNVTTDSYLAFNDYSAGGSTVYRAFLDAASGAIAIGATRALTFGSPTNAGGGGGVNVPGSFLAGAYLPTQNSSPPPESGLFLTDGGANAQYRSVADTVTVSGSCNRISVIDWFELR